jgi:hypothetical protein
MLAGHRGRHNRHPEAWSFFQEKDRKKLSKAGFATPRGGSKGAYQNHVVRSNKVIVPFERLTEAPLERYEDGYVVRLIPEQYFDAPGKPKPAFLADEAQVVVGDNAFVLYRTYESLESFPPLPGWGVRRLVFGGAEVEKRSRQVEDAGHYVLRLASTGAKPEQHAGPPQGIFAPEYANEEENYRAKCVLAWLIIRTYGSPYLTSQADHLRHILEDAGLADFGAYETRGALRHGLTACPLCLRIVRYQELHTLVTFNEEIGLINAGAQVEGATRSTAVNLFHLIPLVYGSLQHMAGTVAWGHANCNTKLGQRKCYSLTELQEMSLKVGILREEDIEEIGWISEDYSMIRSSRGAVWIQLSGDMTPEEWEGVTVEAAPEEAFSLEDLA